MPDNPNLGYSEFPEFDALVASKLKAKRSERRTLFTEDAAILETKNKELEALLAGYRSQFRPVGPHEDMLVRELAASDWRLQFIAKIETSVLWGQMQEIYQTELDGNSLSEVDDKTTSSLMGIAWFRNPAIFSLLVRYQNSARRAYYRALKQLEVVRTGKAGYLPAETTAGQTKPTSQAKVAVASAGSQTNPTERRGAPPETKRPANSAPAEANCSSVNGHGRQEVNSTPPRTR